MDNSFKNKQIRSLYRLVIMLLMWLNMMVHSALADTPFANPGPVVQQIQSVASEMSQLLQSQSGFIWIGSANGLIRFDGVSMKIFSHNPDDANSLSNNNVTGMVEATDGKLWITTYGGGLNRFDPATFEFVHYRYSPDDPSSIVSDHLFAIAKGDGDKLWLGGTGGITLFDTLSGQGERKDSQMNPLLGQGKARFRVLFEDNQQQLWYSFSGEGLYRFNRKNHQISHFTNDKSNPNSLGANKVNRVYQRQNGKIWVATSSGMNRYDQSSNSFTRFELPLKAQNYIKALNIVAIYEDKQQRLWVGTLYNGLSLFDDTQQRFIEINENASSTDALTSMSVTSILQDNSGAIWLTTFGQGLLKIPSANFKFSGLSAKNQSRLTIGALASASDGKIWVSANNNLYELNEHRLTTQLRAQSEGHINKIVVAPDNSLFLSIFREGIFRFDPAAKDPSTLQPLPALPNNNIHTIALDSQGTLWVSLFRSSKQKALGLLSLRQGEKQFTHHIKDDVVSTLLPLGDGRLLLGFRYQGLKIYQPQSGVLTPILYQGQNLKSVWHIFQDSAKRIWLATQDFGLGRLDIDSGRVRFFAEKEGLPSHTIYHMAEDNQGQLWFGSKAGLVRFNPVNHEIAVFDQFDGLPKLQFDVSSITKTNAGRIMLADDLQVVQFDPVTLQSVGSTEPHKVLLTQLKVLNRIIEPDPSDQNNPLTTSIDQTAELKLSYKDYLFSLAFASTNFNQSGKLKYAYKMAGLDDQWIEKTSDDRRATFTALPPKTYEFKVKSTDANGQWTEDYRSLKIIIVPPWWQTNLAYGLYFLMALLAIYLAYRLKTSRLQQRAIDLERGVTERTSTINTLLAQKAHLFANISHEFRTPLTLILSPIERLLSRPEFKAIDRELSLVERSANRLLQMVDQLLEFSKLDNVADIALETVSVAQTLAIIEASFEPLMQSKNQRLVVLPFEDVNLSVIPDSLNKILFNLLTNAHKYTPEHGKITVTVKVYGQQLAIAVSDTGIGISENDHQIIFERFSRITEQHQDFKPGAGIGLALVKELVEANQGQIELVSQLGEGSIFTVTLPISNEIVSSGSNTTATSMIAAINRQLSFTIDPPEPKVEGLDFGQAAEMENRKSLLIIDDNADMRQLLATQLGHRYHCYCAENGQMGLQIAQQHLPDLIISDIMMPLVDGYELAQKLKSDEMTNHIPIILLTAKGGIESRLKGLSLLVDDYMAKPFNLTELELRIEGLLSIRDIISRRAGLLVSKSARMTTTANVPRNEFEQQFLNKLNAKLAEHFSDPELTTATFSRSLNISEKQLQRKLKACYDQTFPQWIRNYRLIEAAKQLESGQRASQVYYAVGFSSHAYFTKCFKAHYGCTPKEYLLATEQ